MNLPYPWHSHPWQLIVAYEDRIPHAILLSGNRGLGKVSFAHFLAHYLLCHQPDTQGACGKCRSCHLVTVDTHPDKKVVASQQAILVEQVHGVRDFFQQTAHFDKGVKVVIIEQAELMNASASAALLKILEEPPANKYFILTSNKPNLILPTIRSRCVDIFFKPFSETDFTKWLKHQDRHHLLYHLSQGSPLYARQLLDSGDAEVIGDIYKGLTQLTTKTNDPIKCAASWQDIGKDLTPLTVVDIMLYHMEDTIRQHQTNHQLYHFYDALLAKRRLLQTSFQLNKLLLLEECCMLFYGLKAYIQ